MNFKIKIFCTLVIVCTFFSCEKEFSELGADMVKVDLETVSKSYNVLTYNNLNAYNVNKNSIISLTDYEDEIGRVKSSAVFQVLLGDISPDFGENVKIDSVVLYLPFYKRNLTDKENKNLKLVTDSLIVYGDLKSVFRLKIFELDEVLKHSDSVYKSNYSFKYMESSPLYSENNLSLSFDSILVKDGGLDDNKTKKIIAGLRVKLDNNFFKNKILDKQGAVELRNNINFKKYFKGLYMTMERVSRKGKGLAVAFNIKDSKAKLTIYYNNKEDGNQTYDFVLGGSGAIISQTSLISITSTLQNQINQVDKKIIASDKIYVQGLSGLHPVVKILDNSTVEKLKKQKYVVNKATVKIYVDNTTTWDNLPEKIELYNYDTDESLIDKIVSNSVYGGKLKTDKNQKYYLFDITNYIHNVINEKDFKNYKLALRTAEYLKLPHRVVIDGNNKVEFKVEYSK